jgi:hypothetical protein
VAGALPAGGGGFVPGMRHGLLAAAGAFLLGAVLAGRFV